MLIFDIWSSCRIVFWCTFVFVWKYDEAKYLLLVARMVNNKKIKLGFFDFWKMFFLKKLYTEKEVKKTIKAVDIKTII